MKLRYLYIFLFIFVFYPEISAKMTLPAFFSSGMVLQQQSHVHILGKTDKKQANISIYTSWNNKKYRITSDNEGKWQLQVSTIRAGGPYEIKISDGSEEVSLENVFILL